MTVRPTPSQKERELDPAILNDIVTRVVDVAHPQKIILFGSAARREMGPNSNVELLVVKEGVHRRELAGRIYENLWGVRAAVDVKVVTSDDIERYAIATRRPSNSRCGRDGWSMRPGEAMPDAIRGAVTLTRFAVQARYPSLDEPVSEQEYDEVVEIACAVVRWAERQL